MALSDRARTAVLQQCQGELDLIRTSFSEMTIRLLSLAVRVLRYCCNAKREL